MTLVKGLTHLTWTAAQSHARRMGGHAPGSTGPERWRNWARTESAEQLAALDVARLDLPTLPDGVDLGSLYELADELAHQGVR